MFVVLYSTGNSCEDGKSLYFNSIEHQVGHFQIWEIVVLGEFRRKINSTTFLGLRNTNAPFLSMEKCKKGTVVYGAKYEV